MMPPAEPRPYNA
ncbi:hypothetical protein D021_3033A, partial [Vibrio parahaemolyticus 10296]